MTFGDKLSLVPNVRDSPSESDYTLHHPWDISPCVPTSVPNKLGVHCARPSVSISRERGEAAEEARAAKKAQSTPKTVYTGLHQKGG
jgi:hypothetical protein